MKVKSDYDFGLVIIIILFSLVILGMFTVPIWVEIERQNSLIEKPVLIPNQFMINGITYHVKNRFGNEITVHFINNAGEFKVTTFDATLISGSIMNARTNNNR